MKRCRVALSLLVVAVGGLVIVFGSADARSALATGPYSMTPAELCPQDELGVMSGTDLGQTEEADYYDRGEETAEDTATVEGDSPDASLQAKSGYRYEYPEESYGDDSEIGSEAQYAEQYYNKYGYHYADPESQYDEAGLDGTMAGEASASVEPSEDTEEEVLAKTAQPAEEADAVASGEDAEMGPYQMEEYHPRYGYRFGRWRSQDAMSTPEAANATTESATPTPAPEAAAAQSQPQSGAVEDRYGYSEYMGEDYLSEIGDSSRETVDSPKQEQSDPESSEPVAPETSPSMNPEDGQSSASENGPFTAPESSQSMDPENSESMDPESSEPVAHAEQPATMDEESAFGDRASVPEAEEVGDSEKSSTPSPEETSANDVNGSEYDYQYGFSHREPTVMDGAEEAGESEKSSTPSPEETSANDVNDSEYDYQYGYSHREPTVTEHAVESEADYGYRYGYHYGHDYDYGANEDDNYDYADPYRQYGNDYGRETMDQEEQGSESEKSLQIEESQPSMQESRAQEETESGIELFAYTPSELLTSSDQDLLRTLYTLCEEPSGVRRAALNEYLETQGTEALDFASRFEDLTGIEFLGLADDLPGVAAFLASYRLLEQSELGVDEASDLLRRSLQQFAPAWIEGVNEITANAYENASEAVNADKPQSEESMDAVDNRVVEALGTLASESFRGLGELAKGLPGRMAQVAWTVLLPHFGADWSVSDLRGAFDGLHR